MHVHAFAFDRYCGTRGCGGCNDHQCLDRCHCGWDRPGAVMYVSPDFPSVRSLRLAIDRGDPVDVYSPGPGRPPLEGTWSVEGPHYPAAHTWYARVWVQDGRVVEVLE